MIGGVGGDSGESEGRTVRVFGWETETAVWCGDLVIVGGSGTGLVGGEVGVRLMLSLISYRSGVFRNRDFDEVRVKFYLGIGHNGRH